jgi:tetratricopeptide (TPR) repeat protein
MKKLKLSFVYLFLLVTCITLALANAQAQPPQQTLNQYVSELQKNPNDYALREKIIKHVQTMKPAPAVPEEARRHYVMAKTLSDEAKKVEDFNDSIAEFRGALLVAPWWAEANRDFGLTLEAAQRYDEAIAYIKLYMATNPGSDRSRAAQDEIYKIEAKKKLAGKAAKESNPAAVSAPKQNTFDDLLRKIDGRRYTSPVDNTNHFMVIDVTGKVFRLGILYPQNYDVPSRRGQVVEDVRDEIRGRETTVPVERGANPFRFWPVSRTYVISDDGDRITYRIRYNDGDVRQYIFLWQR